MVGRFIKMVYVFILSIVLPLTTWYMRWVRRERKFWESFTSMYDCSGNNLSFDDPTLRTMADKAVYLPRHDFGIYAPKGLIDFKKYENWLRCMSVSRAAYLLRSFQCENEAVYVHWDNKGDSLLMTSISGLAIKPEFLAARPRNIWCRFEGGPPDTGLRRKSVMNVTSSLLNYIVDRVYRHILHNGVETTDSKIIAALNYVEPLLLEAPCGA